MSTISHQGYTGSIEASVEDECLHGRILFINDIITYEGATVVEIKAAFESAVDRYLAHCKEVGKAPNKPCSGTFNVRLGEARHRKAAVAAVKRGVTLNEFVCQAVDAAVEPAAPQKIVHEHVFVEEIRRVGAGVATDQFPWSQSVTVAH